MQTGVGDTCTNSVSPVNTKEVVIEMEGRFRWGGGVTGGHACVITHTHIYTLPTVQEERPVCIVEPGDVAAGLTL